MSRISQPVGQVRFTNVAVVRLKKGGKRYEIAAYRNKVLAWRNGTEKDIYEVLQTTNVFTNVSKGVLAKGKELLETFGIEDHVKVAQLILDKGEVEVTGKWMYAVCVPGPVPLCAKFWS
jgi:ribosome maturation protein SDO1